MPAAVLLCLVIAVGDGDSLSARCDASQRPLQVRLATIDAPELRQAFGQAARSGLQGLCLHQRAQLHTLGHDAYGRTLAHVRCRGQDAAAAQVGAGLAWVPSRQAASQPQLYRLQQQARASGAGLWAQRRPMPPWDYRRRHGQP